jgi:small subunit ribosomal protein S20
VANTPSARKRIKQNEKRRLRNRGKSAESATAVHDAIRAIDRAVTQGVLHRNTAARRKSALARKLNAPA